ncbi:nSTAND1 domain-containing NTPase [Lyngbya aestuarii]|uniref:nSTAND1 domain-containing NTPase n=1 Tax=Lyngbya aestuarii TaxID=118322 RepID=UPI00403E3156
MNEVHSSPPQNAQNNEKSLQELVWAIPSSLGQFSLILARCNYGELRKQMVQQLQKICSVQIREIVLEPSVQKLYTTIREQLGNEQPSAVMVSGLELVSDIDQLLTSINSVREEFRKHCRFPLILWVNDEIVRKFIRLAPDFENWTTRTVFTLEPEVLLEALRQRSQYLFSAILDAGADRFVPTEDIFSTRYRLELKSALRDLNNFGQQLTPDLEACLQFVRGRDAYVSDQLDEAVRQYRQSLAFWQQSNNLERQGALLFHIGLCYYRKAKLNREENLLRWQEALPYFRQCLEVFEQAKRSDLVAKFIGQLGKVLRRLKNWKQLQILANQSKRLHEQYGMSVQLAQDYGFLAEVALNREKPSFTQAQYWAEQALQILNFLPKEQQKYQGLYLLLLARSLRQLDKVEAAINSLKQAQGTEPEDNPRLYIQILEELRSLYFEQNQYLEAFRIKQERRSLEQQFGCRAFIGAGRLQPQRQEKSVEAGLNLSPQGKNQDTVAQEIIASGRKQNVEYLIERIGKPEHKLTVIYGQSGVGKSSLVNAGLVPALKETIMGTRDILPITLRVYANWAKDLGKSLSRALNQKGIVLPVAPSSATTIIEQLRQNENRNLLTVLVFDQFEEFFFVCTDAAQRRDFYSFFRDCLDTPLVKVILSMREDYLHYLLECDRCTDLEVINNDILNKNIIFYLGNFSKVNAKSIIEGLTKRSQLQMKPALIDEFVKNLAAELGEVRPIELQVVGAQLQEDKITTLKQYQNLGSNPNAQLVEKWLEAVVQDCGSANQDAVWKVLASLADDKGTRPLRTKNELATALKSQASKLDLILEILMGSGLVFRLRSQPEDHYKLVHDYLVKPIRKRYSFDLEKKFEVAVEQWLETIVKDCSISHQDIIWKVLALLTDEKGIRTSKTKEELAVTLKPHNGELDRILNTLVNAGVVIHLHSGSKECYHLAYDYLVDPIQRKYDEDLEKRLKEAQYTKRRQRRVVIIFATLALGLGLVALYQRTQISHIKETLAESKELFDSNQELEALKKAIEARQKLETLVGGKDDVQNQVAETLWQTVDAIKEYNSLEDHKDEVIGVDFSPDGQLIATASFDKTVKLWSKDGQYLRTLVDNKLHSKDESHSDRVNSVDFSPDGQLIATASFDKTVKLWSKDGILLKTLEGHTDGVFGVTFSPDGQMIATASADKTIKLWKRDGTLLNTLRGHDDLVDGVVFSPDSKTIASASWDKTIKLWKTNGSLLNTLRGHSDRVFGVAFSPDGKTIASASRDKTIKLWKTNGSLLNTLSGHGYEVVRVAFSPDGKTIASTSKDKTIKLWKLDGTLLNTLSGHGSMVYGLSLSPVNQTIATASGDNTVKLWKPNTPLRKKILSGHSDRIASLDFSPDGETIATASFDGTVKLWSKDGRLKGTLEGHESIVSQAEFSPNGQMIASASFDKTVKLWSTDGQLLHTLEGHKNEVYAVAFSPDSEMIASASWDKTVKLWRRDGSLFKTLSKHRDRVYGVAFSPDGEMIASASWDKTVILWNRDGTFLKELGEGTNHKHRDYVIGVSFSPDGEIIATMSKDKTVKLWNREGDLLNTLEGHREEVYQVSFSPDSRILATMSKDKTVKLWNREGNLLRSLSRYGDSDWSVSFNSNEQMTAWAIDEKTVLLWNLDLYVDLNELSKLSCDWLHDYLKNKKDNPCQTLR